jgi:hypothetical protein
MASAGLLFGADPTLEDSSMSAETVAAYRSRLTIDHSRVFNTDQRDFPLLVRLSAPTLRSVGGGGHVAHPQGADLYFTQADGSTRLAHELVAYDGAQGNLEAWVKVPQLSCREDGVLYLYYGGAAAAGSSVDVWDGDYSLVQHGDMAAAGADGLALGEELTVEAWVQGTKSGAEDLQPLVSKWAVLESFDTFSAYDAGATDGLDCVGFYGAVFDGRHVYFCPIRSHRDRTTVHANVLRYDTQGDFYDSQSWEAHDARNTDGLNTVCYYGAAFDGRYVIFTPRDDSEGYHSRVLRYDTHKDFKSAASWEAHDANLPHSHQGVAFDGRHLYFCPGYDGETGESLNEGTLSGKVLRLDTQADFRDPATYRVFDTKTLAEDAVCFDGGAFDGRYIYFVPLTTGMVVQYDTRGDFADAGSWRTYDAKALKMQMNVGAVFDGRYLYFCSYTHSNMIRYDTQGDFADDSNWQTFDAANTSGLDTGGFDGGFYDGCFIYFVPWTRQVEAGEDKSVYHCNYLRYDTRGAFDDPQSWSGHDASAVDGLKSIGYNAGAFDGRYFYGAPLYDGEGDKFHGKVLRYDTLGKQGSFSLRYCDYGHNGGLYAAVPGPSFLINTARGVLGIAAHQALTPGWHYLAGVYNGQTLKLFVDGRVVAERAGSGAMQDNEVAVSIGQLANGTAQFHGQVGEVRVAQVARSDDWLKTAYQNLVDAKGFVRLGDEEEVE